MRAIIVGAGNAGSNLAVKLCQESHDVVLIDHDAEALSQIEAQQDVLTIQGHGCNPRVLEEAELAKADLLVAVTNSDDVNILACYQAAVKNVSYKVARIANPDYLRPDSSLNLRLAGIDLAVNPWEECAKDILNNLKLPGSQEVIRILDGRALAVGIRIREESPLLHVALRSFPRPNLLETIRFIAILRDGDLLIPHGGTEFELNDDVYVVGAPTEIPEFLDWALPARPHIEKVVIVGGGGIGVPLARLLEEAKYPVDLIEADGESATRIAGQLDRTTVILGNALSTETLEGCNLGDNVAFVAGTGNEENNIISCLLARKHGAGVTIAQVTDPQYVPIINSISRLDRGVSTHLSMINAILHHIRGRQIESASILYMLPGELLQVNLTARNSWCSKQIHHLKIPKGAVIATVLRGETICAPVGELTLHEGDRLVLFATPSAIGKLSATFKK